MHSGEDVQKSFVPCSLIHKRVITACSFTRLFLAWLHTRCPSWGICVSSSLVQIIYHKDSASQPRQCCLSAVGCCRNTLDFYSIGWYILYLFTYFEISGCSFTVCTAVMLLCYMCCRQCQENQLERLQQTNNMIKPFRNQPKTLFLHHFVKPVPDNMHANRSTSAIQQ